MTRGQQSLEGAHPSAPRGEPHQVSSPADEPPSLFAAPSISVPKGGGAIRGIGEKFAANPVTGTASMSVPIATSPGRAGFAPQLSLSYDSGGGNGSFGFGWALGLPAVTRKTDKGLPRYRDAEESDVFLLSGAEDLVPELGTDGRRFEVDASVPGYTVHRYRPRIESAFARIERWTRRDDGDVHWRSLSRDNVLTVYGRDAASRIADPADPRRVFGWLISECRDDSGNAIVYDYKPEDGAGVDLAQPGERNRGGPDSPLRTAQRHIKRIRYGNRLPLLDDAGARPPILPTAALAAAGWLFEVVFDYGEHDTDVPRPGDGGGWPCRTDPFSSYRPGFELRNYRLCRRVLMFHHFPTEAGVGTDCLVRSTDFAYREDDSVASFLASVSHTSYRRRGTGYLRKSLPPVTFGYSRAVVGERVHDVDEDSLDNLPDGTATTTQQWVDLDGEGLTGVLTRQGSGWYYKRNESPLASDASARLAPLEPITSVPAGGGQLLDLAGDGRLDLVTLAPPLSGFYERDDDGGWTPFRAFDSMPNVAWTDPGLRFVDLTGDGHADVLLTEDDALQWHPSLGEDGFGTRQTAGTPPDEERGPRLVFADGTETIFLADMSGDGLTDIVRIRNGEVCYWPSLGYGRFGAKVTTDDPPWFDTPDQFDPRRLRLVDIDGSGVTDIIYLGRTRTRCWFNRSGNGWSGAHDLPAFPAVDNAAAVAAVDLLGNGTACLVWSSPLAGSGRAMRYLPLMAEGKPHLLTSTRNNLGAETRVHYAPSTYFYLRDKRDGRPWATRLPFPVHVVERVETLDHVGRNRFVTRYAYHHGYFDGTEREFRGFGMVEQFDTEEFAALSAGDALPDAGNLDAASHVPPVLTRTWFHTGAFVGGERIERRYARDHYPDPDLPPLPDTLLPTTLKLRDGSELPWRLTTEEMRQACRALKGAVLRQEIYARDGSAVRTLPYSVTEGNYTIELLQPCGPGRHAVFFTHAREAVTLHYERTRYEVDGTERTDPRIAHAVTLATDGYGNALRTAAIAYGRRFAADDPVLSADDRSRQGTTRTVYTEHDHTNAVQGADNYRAPLPADTRSYEIIKLTTDPGQRPIDFDALRERLARAGDGSHELPSEDVAGAGAIEQHPYRRPIEHTRMLYRRDDLAGPLPAGTVEARAVPFESYQKALTAGLAHGVYVASGKLAPAELDSVLAGEGGYVQLAGDPGWWIPSGRMFFHPESDASPAQELALARQHFFLARRTRDPFGNATRFGYDSYDLLALETADALHNRVSAGERDGTGAVAPRIDYRVLQPTLVTDANGNRTAVAFDVLGLVAGTAVMGKPGEALGDSLQGFAADLTQAEVDAFLADPRGSAAALLGPASTRMVYDSDRYFRLGDPAVVALLSRERHLSDLAPGAVSPVQVVLGYGDGFSRAIQKKVQAEAGPVAEGGPDVAVRWVGTGWTVFNNKGKPVRRYEPFFTASADFEFARTVGVSSTLYYDPLGRVTATLHPDHTYEKTRFDPWRQETWDANDTVTLEPLTDPDVARFVSRLPPEAYTPTWFALRTQPAFAALAQQRWPDAALRDAERRCATQTVAHAATPTVSHLDPLGRSFVTVLDNGADARHTTRLDLDIHGNHRAVVDAKARVVMRYTHDLTGTLAYQASMEAGERWVLSDVAGQPIRSWDARSCTRRVTYDELRRPTALFVSDGGPERLAHRTVYGEESGDAGNHRTRVFREFDDGGVVSSDAYDYKGNLLASGRRYLVDYKNPVDWQSAPAVEDRAFPTGTSYDALDRAVTVSTPDGSVRRVEFNDANLPDRIVVHLHGAAPATSFVDDIGYDAKGRRTVIRHGNGVVTTLAYDPETFRLIRRTTTRQPGANGFASVVFGDPTVLQDLRYTYDPAGNVTRIEDRALPTIMHANQLVEPVCGYVYDALYRLVEATGREHIGQTAFRAGAPTGDHRDHPFTGPGADPGDLHALRNYVERYQHDAAGNLEQVNHEARNGNWTRHYHYGEPSLIEPAKQSNRLSRTTVGQTTETYGHDPHGNMLSLPHLAGMTWDFEDRLQSADLGGGGIAYYSYDAGGRRIRKVVERGNGTRRRERIYVGDHEAYREYGGDGETVTVERETLHVMDGERRVALVETRTQGSDAAPPQTTRYQLGNHLDSASLELDGAGQLISYEEYHPYGTTAYQAARTAAEVSVKRYRYTGRERDEETGLYYSGARYFAPWLGRWLNCDPVRLAGGINLYAFARGSPVRYRDPRGTNPQDSLDVQIANAQASVDALHREYQATKAHVDAVNQAEAQGPAATRRRAQELSKQATGPGSGELSPSEKRMLHAESERLAKAADVVEGGKERIAAARTELAGKNQQLQAARAKLGNLRAQHASIQAANAAKGGYRGPKRGGGGGSSGGSAPPGGAGGGPAKPGGGGGSPSGPKGAGGSGPSQGGGGGWFGTATIIGLNLAFLAHDLGKADTAEQRVDVLKDSARDTAIGTAVIFNIARIPVIGAPLAAAATGWSIGYKIGETAAPYIPDPVHLAVGETIAEPGPGGWGAGPTVMDWFFIPFGKFIIGDVDPPEPPPPVEQPVRPFTSQELNDVRLEKLKDAY